MRVTVIRDDNVVGVNGVFRSVDLTAMPDGVRVMQWDGTSGHTEYYDDQTANTAIDTITGVLGFIDLWNAAAPPAPVPPTAAEMVAAAHTRINLAYTFSVDALTSGYPDTEIASWPKQENEARAYLANPQATTPWLNSAATSRGISSQDLATLIVGNADALAPLHGALTGKRQRLRDQIDALGASPTQAQLDAIQW